MSLLRELLLAHELDDARERVQLLEAENGHIRLERESFRKKVAGLRNESANALSRAARLAQELADVRNQMDELASAYSDLRDKQKKRKSEPESLALDIQTKVAGLGRFHRGTLKRKRAKQKESAVLAKATTEIIAVDDEDNSSSETDSTSSNETSETSDASSEDSSNDNKPGPSQSTKRQRIK